MRLTLNVQTHNERWSPGSYASTYFYTDSKYFLTTRHVKGESPYTVQYASLQAVGTQPSAASLLNSKKSLAFVITENKQLLVRWITVLIF